MKNKKLINTLALILGVLVVVYLATIVFGGKNERNFKSELINVDTSAVSQILLYPETYNHKEVKIYKDGNAWKVKISETKSVSVPKDKIKGLLQKLTELKIERLVARTPKRWSAFKVDTLGTRVKVYEGSNLSADFVVGKFEMQGRRNFITYVRNSDEDEVYSVNGFISTAFNRKPDSFRNNYVFRGNKADWNKLEFVYPADSSFTMVKDSSNHWFANGTQLDSADVEKYLTSISHLYGTTFVNEFPNDFPKTPTMTLKIYGKNGMAEITCYVKGDKSIITSTYNSENYFDGTKAKLQGKIFKGKSYFLKDAKKHKGKGK